MAAQTGHAEQVRSSSSFDQDDEEVPNDLASYMRLQAGSIPKVCVWKFQAHTVSYIIFTNLIHFVLFDL